MSDATLDVDMCSEEPPQPSTSSASEEASAAIEPLDPQLLPEEMEIIEYVQFSVDRYYCSVRCEGVQKNEL